MSVDIVTQTQIIGNLNGTLDTVTGYTLGWGPMANGDTGAPVSLPGFADRTIQVTGTFGAGGSVAWEGSNDGVNFYALATPAGSSIAITSAGMAQCNAPVLWIRPHVTAGDVTTALTVTAFCRNNTFRF